MTGWGFAQDGIQVVVFNGRSAIATGADPVTNPKLSATDLHKIWKCTYSNWSDIASLGIGVGSPEDGPIEPWAMNSSSGTFASFRDWVRANSTEADAATFDPNAGACVRKLTGNVNPFENDIKPLINNPAALSSSATSVDNPVNWIWWGSYGELSAYSFKSAFTRSGTLYTALSAPVNGRTPSGANILAATYAIGRTLYHVTKNTEADCPVSGSACDFAGNPGPTITAGNTDLNVTGAVGGTGGAVRELTRWICRVSTAKHTLDPYTGANYFTAITGAINNNGFQIVPSAQRTPGSRCKVLT